MEIRKAVQRMGWRFSEAAKKEDRSFKINQQDLEALESIGEYVEQTQKQQYQDHELFAKLFIFTYKRLFEIEGGNILDNGMTAKRRKIYNLLSKPTHQLVEEFTQMLNESEQYALLDHVQGKISHPAELSEADKVRRGEKLKEALKTPENKSKLLGEVWEYEDVKQALEAEVNQAINLFK